MSSVRSGARSVLRWFSPLYVVLIVVQVLLAGEGVFRLRTVYDSDTCKKTVCGGSTTLDPHRFLGFILTLPLAILFLLVALLAWHPKSRVRVISLAVPILTFLQLVLAGIGKWVGSLHVLDAFIILWMFGWLTFTLRREENATAEVGAPVLAD